MTGPVPLPFRKSCNFNFQEGEGNVVTADPCYMSLVNVVGSMRGN